MKFGIGRLELVGLQSALLVVVSLSTSVASARATRVAQVPNGSVKGCATCHVEPSGGGPRNAFGAEIEANFLSVPGGGGVVLWGPALAVLDSDGDGYSNGRELQDPNGTWSMGNPAPGSPILVTNPGIADPPPVPALGSFGWWLLAAALVAIGGATAARAAATPRDRLQT